MKRTALLLLLAAGCAPAAPGDLAPAGTFTLLEVGGRTIPGPSPTEDHVIIERGSLRLGAGEYTLEVAARAERQPEARTESVSGAVEVRGDSLVLRPTSRGDVPAAVFRFSTRGDRLELRGPAPRDDLWVWRR